MEGFVERVTETVFHRGFGVFALRVFLIVAAAIWIYSPAFHGGWIWDDYVYLNAHLHLDNRADLWKTWLEPGTQEDYYPIESAVLLLQWLLWHNETLGYHLTNVFLHIVSALLLWKLLGKIGVRHAWLGGLLFIVHPLMVESVAWIVELKNTLSLPPLLLAMWFYVNYEETKWPRDYLLALGLFLVAMLCKASVMMLPAVILLYIWWKRGRIGWADLKATVPFFALSMLLGVLTARLQHQSALPTTVTVGWLSRFATVGWEMVFFPSKFFYPGNLLPLYPSGLVTSPTAFDLLPWLGLAILLGVLWLNRKGWGRHALLGLGFFLLNLAPVFAFALMNAATMVWNMDHVIYLPAIGLIGLCVAAWAQLSDRLPAVPRFFFLAMTGLLLGLLAWQSQDYAKIYQNEEGFWTYLLRYNPGSAMAHNSLGSVYLHQARFTEAKKELDEALQIDPNDALAHNNMGLLLQRTGRLPEAIAYFRASLQLNPNDAQVRYNFANALAQAGQLPEAMEQYETALKSKPDFAEAHYSLGNALVQSDRLPEAAAQYEEALRIKPDYADAHANLGNALLQLGQIPQAIDQYEQELRITPRDIDVRTTLGLVLLQTGRVSEAEAQFNAILQIDPRNANALSALTKIEGTSSTAPAPAK